MGKPIIELRSMSFSYPNALKKTINNCSLVINEGEMLSILGPNGAGKSTLLNCACGLLRPQEGEILIEEKLIRTLSQRQIASTIGYVQQYQQSAFDYSVFDYVLMGRASSIGLFQKPSEQDRQIVKETMDELGIAYLSDSSVTEISGGERQLAAIARAIVQKPKVIFFDEPTAHLDYGNQIKTLRVINSLQKKGYSIVMTTHTPDHCIMLGGNVAVVSQEGTVIVGKGDELITEELLKKLYNTDLKMVYVEEAKRKVCVPSFI